MIHPIRTEALDAITATVPAETPIHMLNLLLFQPGGQDRYFGDYVGAFRQLMAKLNIDGIAPIWLGNVTAGVAAPDGEQWDAALIVRYPSMAAFRAIVESEAYRTQVEPHRLAALRDWRLIAQVALPLPG